MGMRLFMKKYMLMVCFISLSLSVKSKEIDKLNIYTRTGFDFAGEFDRYSFENFDFNKKKASGLGFEVALEGTTNITEKIEIGAGIGYQNHINPKNTSYREDGAWIDSDDKEFDGVYRMDIKMPKYNSVPVYGILKYNFNANMGVKPYLKAVLGYSFNIKDGNAGYTEFMDVDKKTYKLSEEKFDTKVEDGAYVGIGVGIEKDNFYIDLTQSLNTASVKTKFSYEENNKQIDVTKKDDFNCLKWTLSMGYKFIY